MIKSDAITQIQEGGGFRLASTGITAALGWAQRQLETGQTLPWFLRVEDEALVGTASSGQIALPTGFIREDEENDWWVTVGSGASRVLKKRNWGFVKDHRQDPTTGDDETGTPIFYAIRTSVIEVSPVPSEAWTLTATYFKHDDDIEALPDGDENAWLTNAPDILWSMAGMYYAKKLRDADAVSFFQEVYTAAERLLKNEIAEREAANREYVMGSEA